MAKWEWLQPEQAGEATNHVFDAISALAATNSSIRSARHTSFRSFLVESLLAYVYPDSWSLRYIMVNVSSSPRKASKPGNPTPFHASRTSLIYITLSLKETPQRCTKPTPTLERHATHVYSLAKLHKTYAQVFPITTINLNFPSPLPFIPRLLSPPSPTPPTLPPASPPASSCSTP